MGVWVNFMIVDLVKNSGHAQFNWAFQRKAVSFKRQVSQIGDVVVTALQQTETPSDLPDNRLFLGNFVWL